MNTASQSRRQFLAQSGLAAAALALPSIASAKVQPKLRISLAQWTINKDIRSGKVDNLDFAKVASDHGIKAIEYVNQFFMDKAKDEKYLAELNKRAADHGVKQL